jgi:hypothetical protein
MPHTWRNCGIFRDHYLIAPRPIPVKPGKTEMSFRGNRGPDTLRVHLLSAILLTSYAVCERPGEGRTIPAVRGTQLEIREQSTGSSAKRREFFPAFGPRRYPLSIFSILLIFPEIPRPEKAELTGKKHPGSELVANVHFTASDCAPTPLPQRASLRQSSRPALLRCTCCPWSKHHRQEELSCRVAQPPAARETPL